MSKILLKQKNITEMPDPYLIYAKESNKNILILGYADNKIMAEAIRGMIINKLDRYLLCNYKCLVNGVIVKNEKGKEKESNSKIQHLLKEAYNLMQCGKKCENCIRRNVKIRKTEKEFKSYCKKSVNPEDLKFGKYFLNDVYKVDIIKLSKITSEDIQNLKF